MSEMVATIKAPSDEDWHAVIWALNEAVEQMADFEDTAKIVDMPDGSKMYVDLAHEANTYYITSVRPDWAIDVGACGDCREPTEAVVMKPIETAPKDGSKVILGGRNELGKWRTEMARYHSPLLHFDCDPYEGCYLNDADEWCCPLGWYTASQEDCPCCGDQWLTMIKGFTQNQW